VGAELFCVDRRTGMMKLIFTFAMLLMHQKMETCASTNHWEILKISSEHNSLCSFELYTEYIQYRMSSYMCLNMVEGSSEMLVNLCNLGIII
jgi:hypothetical protein